MNINRDPRGELEMEKLRQDIRMEVWKIALQVAAIVLTSIGVGIVVAKFFLFHA